MFDKEEFNRISSLSESEIYLSIEEVISSQSLGARPKTEDERIRKAKEWFSKIITKSKSKMCSDSKIQDLILNPKNYGRVDIAAILFDIFTTEFTGIDIPIMEFVILILREGVEKICEKDDQ